MYVYITYKYYINLILYIGLYIIYLYTNYFSRRESEKRVVLIVGEGYCSTTNVMFL